MKLIAVSLSSECIKQPRCSFCYQGKENIQYRRFWLSSNVGTLIRAFPEATVSLEYNGYNLDFLIMSSCWYPKDVTNLTMTTMPRVVTPIFCGAIASHYVTAVALSYDSEKVSSVGEWLEKAVMIKRAGMKLSCNFLLESTTKIPKIPLEILKTADQLNLLALKPTGKITNIEGVNLLVEYCKNFLPVAVDNCLGYQLGYTSYCNAGKDFCHVRPDGVVMDCCFQGDCFLWLRKNAGRIAERALEAKCNPETFDVVEYIQKWLGREVERRW